MIVVIRLIDIFISNSDIVRDATSMSKVKGGRELVDMACNHIGDIF